MPWALSQERIWWSSWSAVPRLPRARSRPSWVSLFLCRVQRVIKPGRGVVLAALCLRLASSLKHASSPKYASPAMLHVLSVLGVMRSFFSTTFCNSSSSRYRVFVLLLVVPVVPRITVAPYHPPRPHFYMPLFYSSYKHALSPKDASSPEYALLEEREESV